MFIPAVVLIAFTFPVFGSSAVDLTQVCANFALLVDKVKAGHPLSEVEQKLIQILANPPKSSSINTPTHAGPRPEPIAAQFESLAYRQGDEAGRKRNLSLLKQIEGTLPVAEQVPDRSLEAYLADSRTEIRISRVDGKPVGYVAFTASKTGIKLNRIAVAPDFQKRTLGTQLLQSVRDKAKEEQRGFKVDTGFLESWLQSRGLRSASPGHWMESHGKQSAKEEVGKEEKFSGPLSERVSKNLPPLEVQIVELKDEDLPRVKKIEKASFPYPWTNKDFRLAREAENSLCLVAKNGDNIVGYMMLEFLEDEINVLNFAVHPDYRERKVGSKMINELKEMLFREGRNSLRFLVREKNDPTHLFLRENGLEAKAEEIEKGTYVDSDEDGYVFRFTLDGALKN